MADLLVPIQAHAIWLSRARQVVGPLADYERLPWFDGAFDRNGSVPNLAAAINAEPFSEHTAWLEPGVHLHWSLPDGLKRGSTQRSPERPVQMGDLWFPPAPNRWLVVRQTPQQAPERAWLVESDYVHPAGTRPPRAIAYPRSKPASGVAPFHFLGRQIELDPRTMEPVDPGFSPAPASTLGDFEAILTGVGAGDPLFTAHYPGCRSVFGLWDDKPVLAESRTYLAYGWFSEGIVEPLANMVSALRNDPVRALSLVAIAATKDSRSNATSGPAKPWPDPDPLKLTQDQWTDALNLALGERFGWRLGGLPPGVDFPTNIVCHGGTSITAGTDTSDAEVPAQSELGIGSSAAEAVAALMLNDTSLSPETEDRLVQALAATDLSKNPLDLGLKLAEARHTEQFRAYTGHTIWMIRPADQAATGGEDDVSLSLPDELAHELNQLNELQEKYDHTLDAMDGLRQELFADWSRYMAAAYPEGDADAASVDLDRVRGLVRQTRLQPLQTLQRTTGQIYYVPDPAGGMAILDKHPLVTVAPQPVGPMVGNPTGIESTDVATWGGLLGFDVSAGEVIDNVWLVTTSRSAPDPATDPNRHAVRLVGDEYVTAIFGESGPWRGVVVISKLGFETSHGRSFGPFGWNEQPRPPFRLDAPSGTAIVGLRRRRGMVLQAVGIVVGPPPNMAALLLDFPDTLASRVVDQHSRVRAALDEATQDGRPLVLAPAPGPRYWRPNDPVIVLDDSLVGSTAWQGFDPAKETDGQLTCYGLQLTGGWTNDGPAFAGVARAPQADRPGDWHLRQHIVIVSNSDDPSWHVLQMEWEVELKPLAAGSNVDNDAYAPDFVTRSHTLPVDSAELLANRDLARAPTYQYLSGRTFINPSAARLINTRRGGIPKELADQLNLGTVSPNVVALPLGGFHDHLLMLRQEPQIAIADPIGLPTQRDFTGNVGGTVGTLHPASPLPDSPFHPIRSGDLVFERLRVIDRYGRTKTWKPTAIRTAKSMRPDGSGTADRAVLPVRFAQAARLNFRWLSAADGDVETNVHPASSPVCGWLLPNALEGSAEIYARSGDLLGAVTTGGVWTPAPGDAVAPRSWNEITDRTIRRVVRWLTMPSPTDAVGAFVELLEAALEQIDPQDAAQNQARSLLIGRPMAIVRARLDLELMGPAAADQSMDALRTRIAGGGADSHGVGDVQVAVRLGEINQLNDGLCGYWVEDAALFRGNTFYAPHGLDAQAAHDRVAVPGDDPRTFPLRLTAAGTAETVTMLVDPRGVVHATCGVLPTKSIAIPPDHYVAQTAALRATFETAPVLTVPNEVALPLPSEPGYSWSWLEHSDDGWLEVPHHPTVHKSDLAAGFGAQGNQLWARLVDRGRIVPQDRDDVGLLMPGDQNPSANPSAPDDTFKDLKLTTAAVERGLHDIARCIRPAELAASFGGRAVARDGWLQLRQAPAPVPRKAAPTPSNRGPGS